MIKLLTPKIMGVVGGGLLAVIIALCVYIVFQSARIATANAAVKTAQAATAGQEIKTTAAQENALDWEDKYDRANASKLLCQSQWAKEVKTAALVKSELELALVAMSTKAQVWEKQWNAKSNSCAAALDNMAAVCGDELGETL